MYQYVCWFALLSDEETKKICAIPSILDFPNRQALARQGFYGDEFAAKEKKEPQEKKVVVKPTAAEKRKQFQHSVRSQSKNWSLTEDSEEMVCPPRDWKRSMDSWDRGFILKSFSDRFSSDSSLEDADSFEGEPQTLHKQNSISTLRKQYQETIRRSIDGEYPVFTEDEDGENENGDKSSGITEIRKKQVDRLMLSIDDDGDYVTQLKPGPQKGNLKLAQKSTQSTITGSPHSPSDANFSFDENLRDGEDEFDLSASQSSPRHSKHSHSSPPSVSIIVEEETSPLESSLPGGTNPRKLRAHSNELSLSLSSRSDSCHTLVPQDSNYETETTEGDMTPRVGDTSPGIVNKGPNFENNCPIYQEALSESSSSISTLKNLAADEDDLENGSRTRSENKNTLKPQTMLPQESFELEEVRASTIPYFRNFKFVRVCSLVGRYFYNMFIVKKV